MACWQVPEAEDPPTWLAALRPPSSGEAQGDSLWETIEVLRSFEAFVLSFLFKVTNLKCSKNSLVALVCLYLSPLGRGLCVPYFSPVCELVSWPTAAGRGWQPQRIAPTQGLLLFIKCEQKTVLRAESWLCDPCTIKPGSVVSSAKPPARLTWRLFNDVLTRRSPCSASPRESALLFFYLHPALLPFLPGPHFHSTLEKLCNSFL